MVQHNTHISYNLQFTHGMIYVSCMRCLHAHIPSHSPTPSHMSMPSVICHAPDPGPTRLADPNRSPGCDTIYTIYILYCTGTLIDLFFLRAELVPMGIQIIYVITKKIICTYTKELPPEWCSSQSIHIYKVPFTYTCTISITKHQRLRKQRW